MNKIILVFVALSGPSIEVEQVPIADDFTLEECQVVATKLINTLNSRVPKYTVSGMCFFGS